MALNSLFCADVPLSNYSLTHSLTLCFNYFLTCPHTNVLILEQGATWWLCT